MTRILLFTALALLLLASCTKEEIEPQARMDVLDDIVGIYIGETTETGVRAEIETDINGNILDITEIRVDQTYEDTIQLVRQSQDSMFTLENKGRVLAIFKWNEEFIYQADLMRKDTTGDILMKMDDGAPFQLKFEMNARAGNIDTDPTENYFDLNFYFLGTKEQ